MINTDQQIIYLQRDVKALRDKLAKLRFEVRRVREMPGGGAGAAADSGLTEARFVKKTDPAAS